MGIDAVTLGDNPPHDVNVVIEIPVEGGPVKYEFNKESGVIQVDRFLEASMRYPGNYGFIPRTLSEDGDALDVLVCTAKSVFPGTVMSCRPIGLLNMEDEAGVDIKIISVPSAKLSREYDNLHEISDLPKTLIQQVQHFFEHYKDLEPGKWVKVKDWSGREEAHKVISEAVNRYDSSRSV